MEIINKKGWARWSMLCLACTLFLSCSDTEEGPEKKVKNDAPISLSVRAEETSASPELACLLYLFSQTKEEDGYRLKQVLSPSFDEETLLPLEDSELSNGNFRFLFVATPRQQNEIKLVRRNNEDVSLGTPWEEIVLATVGGPLTVDNYYDLQEMTGRQIIEAGKVEGHLSRLSGQILFNFYKGGADDPVAIDPKKAQSVFDRIYQVDITYTGYAWGVTFGTGTTLEPVYKTDASLEQSYRFSLTADLKVEVPQPDNHLESYEPAPGGVRMPGGCFLPTDKNLHITMRFHYYDTTPICNITGSDTGHSHDSNCYAPKEIQLRLPASSSEGLSVKPNYFTVNKAGLPCDRVIDIEHSSGLNIQTSWNVSNSN